MYVFCLLLLVSWAFVAARVLGIAPMAELLAAALAALGLMRVLSRRRRSG